MQGYFFEIEPPSGLCALLHTPQLQAFLLYYSTSIMCHNLCELILELLKTCKNILVHIRQPLLKTLIADGLRKTL